MGIYWGYVRHFDLSLSDGVCRTTKCACGFKRKLLRSVREEMPRAPLTIDFFIIKTGSFNRRFFEQFPAGILFDFDSHHAGFSAM